MAVQTYTGGCQCGAVRFEAEADIDETIACNCSRCGRLGLVLSFTGEDGFSLLSGEENLSEYQFNRHAIHHLFCRTCGVQSFSRGQAPDGRPMVAINVRCLDAVDPNELTPRKFDGRSL